MTNKLKTIPLDAVKLVECCFGYTGDDPTKVIVQSLWRTKNGTYLITDNEGLILGLESRTSNLIVWIDCALMVGENYYYCCGDMDIHALREEFLTLDDVTNLKFIPENAEKLITANFGERIETLWEYYDGFEDKYLIDYGGEIRQKSYEDIIYWINNLDYVNYRQWRCYDMTPTELKECLVSAIAKKKDNL